MKIRGQVVSKGTLIADASVRLSLVKRSDGEEISVFDGRSVDDGTFEVTQNILDGLPCNSQNFGQVKYSVEKNGHQSAQGAQPIVDEDTNLRNIDLARNALRVHGRVTSKGRPVRAATVMVQIDDVERASIRTDHEGKFTRDIDGSYESHTLVWAARRFGYISATGSISEIRSTEVDVGEVDLKPHWWTARVVLLSLGLGLALVIYLWVKHCPEPSVTAADFQKKGANSQDRQIAFAECLSLSQVQCGKDKDTTIRQCLENRGYTFSK